MRCPEYKLSGYIVCEEDSCDTSAQCDVPQGVAPAVREPEPATRFPKAFALSQPVPNPFNPVTTVRYEVPQPGARVNITVYNVLGQRVIELVNTNKEPGYHSVEWDGINRSGNHVASGVYFIHMRATSFVRTVKAVVLK